MQFLNFENRPRHKEMNATCLIFFFLTHMRKMRICLLINGLFFILMHKLRAASPNIITVRNKDLKLSSPRVRGVSLSGRKPCSVKST